MRNLRSKSVEKKYVKFIDKLKSDGVTIADHVRGKYLQGKISCLADNDFPYDCDAQHMVLWMCEDLGLEMARCMIRARVEGDFLVFKNPTAEMSVSEIPHYQVFVKKISFQ